MSAESAIQDRLSASMEDYLEAVLLEVRKSRVARVRDIADRLQVGMPSVTAALKGLSKRGLVNYDPYEFITLTDRGQDAAEGISRRHGILRSFLTGVLGLDDETAEANACRMEHAVDEVVLRRLGSLVEFLRARGSPGGEALAAFRELLVAQAARDVATKERDG